MAAREGHQLTQSPTLPLPRGPSRFDGHDLKIIQQATLLIDDLGSDLDRLLMAEPRAAERLRLLRETTNRITRAANDAIQAYARARSRVQHQLELRDRDRTAEALAMRASLHAARQDLLRSLRAASLRYPWTEALGSEADASETEIPRPA